MKNDLNPTHILRELKSFAVMLELLDEDPYKIRAYNTAIRKLEGRLSELPALIDTGRLDSIPGIGSAISEKITAIAMQGTHHTIEAVRRRVPAGLMTLLKIPGLGPKKVRTLWQDLEITTLEDLQSAAEDNLLATLKGFGKKTQDRILESIETLYQRDGLMRLYDALGAAVELEHVFCHCSAVHSMTISGPLRRRMEIVDSIDFVMCVDDIHAVRDYARSDAHLDLIPTDDDTIIAGLSNAGILVRLTVLPDPSREAGVLFETTGNDTFIAAFKESAEKHGVHYDTLLADATRETDIFDALNMQFIPPETRETAELIDAAYGDAPLNLVDSDCLIGTLHNHTTYSDGANTIPEMANTACAMGLTWLGISDHSASAFYAHGLSADDVRRQWDEIDRVNEKLGAHHDGFRIFKGIESDILKDGSLDYDDDILDGFDYVIASIHGRFGIADQTERILTAVRNPHTDILGHMTGRLLLHRDAYHVDADAVIAACAESGTAIELNCNPWRLDIDWRLLRRAVDSGVRIILCPDAHAVDQLSFLDFGVWMARKAGLRKHEILNTLDADSLLKTFSAH